MGARRKFDRPLKRRPGHKKAKHKLVVFCEGEVTEPDYLRNFAQHHGNGLVEVKTIPKGTPKAIVDAAIREAKDLRSRARTDSFEEETSVWGMFDIDAHPDIPDLREQARSRDIQLAISNPCFELWGVLHFERHNAPGDSERLQRKLAQLMPGYDHQRSRQFRYEQIKERYALAREHALWLSRQRREEDNADGNPSCNVYELLERIIAYGKT